MSAWKLVIKELYAAGKPMRTTQFPHVTRSDVHKAQRMGLVQTVCAVKKGTANVVDLTPLGRDWCEGRVQAVRRNKAQWLWVATWLRALPVGLRLQ